MFDVVSLGEFGKHLPTVTSSETQNKPPDPSVESGCGSGRSQGGRQGASNAPATSEMQDFEVETETVHIL